MQDVSLQMGILISRAEKCANESKSIQYEWESLEKEIFSLLHEACIKPGIIQMRTDRGDEFFQVDWESKRIVQIDQGTVIVNMDQISMFGKVVANIGKNSIQEEEGIDDVN